MRYNMLKRTLFPIVLLLTCVFTNAQTPTKELTVEYLPTPLGIDVEIPRFGWQMETKQNEIGQFQKGYQIQVRSEGGELVRDSRRVNSDSSLAIPYEGQKLQPRTEIYMEPLNMGSG
ncbi:hypothetical protein NYZ99_03290 [Maribacter litopenaei]|uniref:Uncharacterized protein n=1 Tax=Maribacter litopenaei TaxID=2976127 RepID=A0ABY5Y922_9FLAO|nr:hypothetical protein [Maribacter litopenaei]UWX55538.1 hypothetical protein NYZ99_03290 [Maribacter litopenaei]